MGPDLCPSVFIAMAQDAEVDLVFLEISIERWIRTVMTYDY